jgi:cobalt-zinc-cadmium efflux system outer membrane protein
LLRLGDVLIGSWLKFWRRALVLNPRYFIAFILFVPFVFGQKLPPGTPGKGSTLPLPQVPADLDLPKAEKLLWDRNLTIITTRYQLDASQAARLIAGYKPNPFVQLGMEQIPVYSPIAGSYPRFVSTNPDAGANPVYTAQFNKLFERGDKRGSRIEQADQIIAAAKAQIDDTYRTQLFALRQAFASAFLARENLSNAQAQDANYQKVQQLTEERVKAGDLAQVALFRVRSGRLPFAQAIVDAQNAYEQAVQDILNLLNARPPDAPLVTSQVTYPRPSQGVPETTPNPTAVAVLRAGPTVNVLGSFTDAAIPLTLAQVRDIALQARPDVQQARDNLKAAQAGTKLAQAQRHRDISVGMEYQRVGDDNSLGVVAQVPLFLYNNQKAGIAQAAAQEHGAETQLRQAEIQAVTDVQKAFQGYLAARQGLDLYTKDNLAQVVKLRDIAEFSYQHGATSLFELLDTERTFQQTQMGYNQARENYQLAIWQLEEAVGKPLL